MGVTVLLLRMLAAHGLHAQHADALPSPTPAPRCAAKLRKCASITLRGICAVSKWKPFCARDFQHVQMHGRVLVPGEADVAHLAGLFRVQHGGHGALVGEHPVGVFHAQDLVVLEQVEVIGLEAREAIRRSAARRPVLVRPSILVIRKTLSR